LTIRRKTDGGNFMEGEANRTMLFARGLAFADTDKSKNFAFVDFEEDFYVPSLQDAAMAFGTRIIRSCHNMHETIPNIALKLANMRVTGYEIAKIACKVNSLAEVTTMFREARKIKGSEHIVCAMGPFGLPSRILSTFFNSYLMYVSPSEMLKNTAEIGHIDPATLEAVYHFHRIGAATKIFGVTGYPLTQTRSPEIHNAGYARHGMNSVYIPIRASTIEETLEFADTLGIRGLSVTIPHKESVLKYLSAKSDVVQKIGACNTMVRTPDGWYGDNTDAKGLELALLDFLKVKNFSGMRIAIIGAGGAAKAAAYAVKKLKGKACIFNRTITKAKLLAEQYGFKWARLNSDSFSLLEKYSELIIQTTSKGMGSVDASTRDNDPLYFYNFSGKETLYDIIYTPDVTPVMARAAQAGCRTAGGFSMLQHQGYEQFLLFTGETYD
jgi:3-dehydroquinate dehydratase/shikimate dehydrogenase